MDSDKTIELAAQLNGYEPGFLPEPLFVSIARLAVLTAVECIPLRRAADGTIEVLLFKRPDTDPIWPGMLHTPGTVVRPSDATLEDSFKRLFKDELGNQQTYIPLFIGTDLIHHKRGGTVTLEHLLRVDQALGEGKFYDVDNIPDHFISQQRPMVQRAVERFKVL